MCRVPQAQRLPSLCYSFVNLFLVNIYRIFSICQALYLGFCTYSLNFPNEAHYMIYIFQNRKLNFRELKWSILNHTGRIQDSKKKSDPLFTLPIGLMSLLVIQVGQRKYPFKTQANWVFVLYPVRGNKLK